MMRVAIYIRVSDLRQTEGPSLDDQEQACRAFAERMGWIVVAVYREEGRSAFHDNLARRPQFQQMRKDAAAGQFDRILVNELSRFARRQKVQFAIADELQEKFRVKVSSATENFDTETTSGWINYSILAFSAELRSRQLSDRIRQRRAAEVAAGRHLGRVPVGYAPGGRGTLLVQEPYAGMVRAALNIYATGQYSRLDIACALTDQGHTMPSGRGLKAEDIGRIVENAAIYAGKVRSGKTLLPGKHPPLIDEELFVRVEEAASRRSRAKRRYARTKEPDALLAGLVFCEACRQRGQEAKLYYQSDDRPTVPRRTFRCSCKAQTGRCAMPASSAGVIEEQVLLLCDRLALPPELMEEALGLLDTPSPAPVVDRRKIEEKMRRLARLYADGFKSDEDYTAELAALRAQLEGTTVVQAPPRITPQQIARYLSDLPTLIRRGSVGEKRAVFAELFDQIYAAHNRVTAFRPTRLYATLVEAAISVTRARY